MRLAARCLALTASTTLAIGVLAAPAVAASPAVQSRMPAADSFVAPAPGGVTVTFDQPIATSSTISVAGPMFAPPCNKTAPTNAPGTSLSCSFLGGAAGVPDGTYTVSYTANSTGTDPATTGSYVFHVDAESPGNPTVVSTNPVDNGSRRSNMFTYVVNASEDLSNSSRVDIFDSTQTQVATTKTVSGSTITTTPVSTLSQGAYTARIHLVDVSGRAPAPVTRSFTIDNTAPAAPVISTPLAKANIANSSAFPVSGTGEPGAVVRLTSNGINKDTTVDGSGAWSTTIDVSSQDDGTISFSAIQTDGAGNASPASTTRTTTKDTVRPRVTGQAVTPAQLNSAGTTATVTGKVDNGSNTNGEANPVSVSADDAGNAATAPVTAQTTALSDGTFSVGLDTASLGDGQITYTIVATDPSGNPSNPMTTTNNKDTVAPNAPTVAFNPASVNNANKGAVTISGTSNGATAEIVVSDDNPGTADLTFTAPVSSGSYSRSFDMTPLADGTLTATVRARDSFGNLGPAVTATALKDVVAPATPTVTVSPDPINNAGQAAVTVSGSTNGDSVRITLSDGPGGGADIVETASAGGGTYSRNFNTTSLADGDVTVTVVALDTAGNPSAAGSREVLKDTVVPGQPSSLSATPTTYLPGSTTLAVSGNTATGDALASGLVADVVLSDSDADTPDVTKPGVTVSMGGFSTSFSRAEVLTQVDGPLTVTARIRDAVGNIGAGRTANVTKNAGVLTLATTTPAAGSTVQSPASVKATYTENLNPTTSSITVKNAGNNTVAGTTSVNGKTITFVPSTTLSDAGSPYTVTVSAVDAGDGSDTETNAFSFTVDNTPAPQPTISSVTNPVTPANEAAVSVSGSAGEAGVSVTVTISDGDASVTRTVTAGSGGAFTASSIDVSSLADGVLAVTARSVDGPGNQSMVSATTQITKDTVGPTQSSSSPVDGATVAPPATVSMTFDEDLGTGSISIDGVTGTSEVSGSTVTFTPSSPLADGDYTAKADVTDELGNESTGETSFTVDGTGPSQTGATPADGSTVPPPATVSITFDDDLDMGSITIDGVTGTSEVSGDTVTFTPDAALPDGDYTATADVTDALGNQGTGSTSFTVDDEASETTTTLDALPRRVTFPTAITLSGQVTRGDASAAYGDVAVSVTDSAGTRTVLTLTPDASGAFSGTYVPTENGVYRATYLGDGENGGSTSLERRVAMKLGLSAASKKGKASQKAKIKGKVAPKQAGVEIKVFELTKSGRTLIGTTTTNGKGKFKVKAVLGKGSRKLLVKAKGSKTYKGNKARVTAVRT